jgi:hypothetical protein
MRIVIEMELEVKIPADRANVNEIFMAVQAAMLDARSQAATKAIEGYEDQVIKTLCSASGRRAKRGLGGHEVKGQDGKRCRYRTFRRAGRWSDERTLYGSDGIVVKFRPRTVECVGCGRRVTPILEALELEDRQRKTDELLLRVVQSVAETSYRRGSDQLEVFGEVPIPKSTAHRMVAEVDIPTSKSEEGTILGADGTGFKRQPGKKGEVRFVLEIRENGKLHPIGVWAGTNWEDISKEVKERQAGQASLFLSDGERALERWMGRLAQEQSRCHWHFSRDLSYALWQDGVSKQERDDEKENTRRLLAIELPAEDMEELSPRKRLELGRRIESAEAELADLQQTFLEKGYDRAATYVGNAKDRLFGYLRTWMATGIACPRATSIIENLIRELVRRLKKIGWNWSDVGAARMGRIVMVRRYDHDKWEEYWKKRMNLQGRCTARLTRCEYTLSA